MWGGAVWGRAVCGEAVCRGTVCGGAVCGRAVRPVTRRSTHTHTIASSTPSKRRIPHFTLSHLVHACSSFSSPALVPAHSSSQVVHCRVCSPHPLHAPVLVLHLAVYPANPTQDRVGLTDRLTHSAQTQCNLTRRSLSLTEIFIVPRQ